MMAVRAAHGLHPPPTGTYCRVKSNGNGNGNGNGRCAERQRQLPLSGLHPLNFTRAR